MIETRTYYCDFHIHIGRSQGRPVKMAAAPSLTLSNVLDFARSEKGLDIITIIDGVCSGVLQEFNHLEHLGIVEAMPGGGYRHENGLVVFLGAEVEVEGPNGGHAHFGCWFGSIHAASEFQTYLSTVQKNPSLSSQKAYVDAFTLQDKVHQFGGLFVVHHAFTPHKGLYGNCVRQWGDMLNPDQVDALELGLSADSDMADCLTELSNVTYLSNSDAHSLGKIAREYNKLRLLAPTFEEVRLALHRKDGRRIEENFGLHPLLGKYHRTYCKECSRLWIPGASTCVCKSSRSVMGVYDRLLEIRDRNEPIHPEHRPSYTYQIPLEFIPGLGPKMMEKLMDAFGTEMNVLHRVSVDALSAVVGEKLARLIDSARTGSIQIQSGGGGIYGKLQV